MWFCYLRSCRCFLFTPKVAMLLSSTVLPHILFPRFCSGMLSQSVCLLLSFSCSCFFPLNEMEASRWSASLRAGSELAARSAAANEAADACLYF